MNAFIMSVLFQAAEKAYTTPGHPTAFGGKQLLKRYYGNKLSSDEIDKLLQSNYAYGLHKEYRKPSPRNPFYVHYIRQMAQLDLVHMERWGGQDLPELNDGIRFLCVCIDCFTRKMWVQPMKDKTKKSALTAIQTIMEQVLSNEPYKMFDTALMDKGNEFINNAVKPYFKQMGTKMIHPNSPVKAGIVERVNRSLQSLLYRYMTEFETNRYLDKLQDIVETYNKRPHRSIGHLSPNDAELEQNQEKVLSHQLKHFNQIKQKQKRKQVKLYKVGDIVRLHNTKKNVFARGYHWNQEPQYYKIIKVHTRMPVPMYSVKSTDTNRHLRRRFYREELVKVASEIYRIEKVLQRKVVRGVPRLYVKWQYFTKPSWIDESNVVQTFVNN